MKGRPAQIAAYSKTCIFNSSKAVVLFPVPAEPSLAGADENTLAAPAGS